MNIIKALTYFNKLPRTAYISFQEKYIIVRFYKTKDKKTFLVLGKRFYYKEFSVPDNALRCARAWRNKWYIFLLIGNKINPFKLDKPTRSKMSNNTTGRVGVILLDNHRLKTSKNGIKYVFREHAYLANWIEYLWTHGSIIRKHRTKYFSITKWGKEEAFRLASEYREKMEKILNNSGHIKLQQEYRRLKK